MAEAEEDVDDGELKENETAELTKLRDDSNELTQRIHHLEAEIDASLVLAREACAERDQLREMLDSKQSEIEAEDQKALRDMRMLLSEFSGNEVAEDQRSSAELLKQLEELIAQNTERLVKRAEVSNQVGRSEKFGKAVETTATLSGPCEPAASRLVSTLPRPPPKRNKWKNAIIRGRSERALPVGVYGSKPLKWDDSNGQL